MNDIDPVLYIVMRSDLHSMAGGKGMAQAAHAANAFADTMESDYGRQGTLYNIYNAWKKQTTQGFGTTIVLGATDFDFQNLNLEYDSWDNPHVLCEKIHDPTYPLRDGNYTHLIPVDTCMYVFLDRNNVSIEILSFIQSFELYPTFEVINE